MAAASQKEEGKDRKYWEEFTQEELDKQTPEETSVAKELCHLAYMGELEKLQKLATTENCEWRSDTDGRGTPLHLAARSDSSNATATVQHLLSLQASVDSRDASGSTALHCAAFGGNAAAVPVLAAAGAAVNAVDGGGDTPLMEAAFWNKPAVAAALLEAGADVTMRNSAGRTAREKAEFFGKKEAERLLARGEEEAGRKSEEKRQQEVQEKLQQWQQKWKVANQKTRVSGASSPRPRLLKREKTPQPVLQPQPQPVKPRPSPLSVHYPVTKPQGICLVINNEFYSDGLTETRTGSRRDVQRICTVFSELQFELKVEQNLTAEEMWSCAIRAAQRDHSKFGAFVCFLMAHGTEGAVYGTDGERQKVDEIISLFGSNKCRSLSGRPKIFFVQACCVLREQTDSGQSRDRADCRPATPAPPPADFLLCYATTKGAFRNTDTGSHFVQAVCDFIETECVPRTSRDVTQRRDLVSILTRVNAHLRKTPAYVDNEYHTPVVETRSTLSRDVMLHPDLAKDSDAA